MVTYIDPVDTAQFILRGERLYRPMWMTPSICVFGFGSVHNAELLLDRCVEPTPTVARDHHVVTRVWVDETTVHAFPPRSEVILLEGSGLVP